MAKSMLVVLVTMFTLGFSSIALAHSAVSPSQTATSKYETFTLSVPTEKEVPTTAIRLLIPGALDRVTPFVKPGWNIKVTKDASEKVTQIEWTGGMVPAEQKDIFQFTARTGTEGSTLIWKVYQTYQDGEVVAWDQDPKSGDEVENPYSTTEVKADVPVSSSTKDDQAPFVLSLGALAISMLALWRAYKNRLA